MQKIKLITIYSTEQSACDGNHSEIRMARCIHTCVLHNACIKQLITNDDGVNGIGNMNHGFRLTGDVTHL